MRKYDIQNQMASLEKRITLVTLLSLSTLIVVKENKNIWAKILFAIVDILLIAEELTVIINKIKQKY
ncbi:MAG TPA: hypothetical protein IAC96_12820 [Candidatus Fimimorpha faecalis]|uniref:Uncharacterized protein n=1 Tax=Candidatus Fimimorpha faecalis TaxID=2840824 RepID=A0A9D1JEI6_9FIRM|nr:hypothetical protein [Candidatus Fimimorpha faecalis]